LNRNAEYIILLDFHRVSYALCLANCIKDPTGFAPEKEEDEMRYSIYKFTFSLTNRFY